MNYLIDCYWVIKNTIEARLEYNNNFFWEELNSGYYQMKDEYMMKQPNFDPYNLSGRDTYYSYKMRDV